MTERAPDERWGSGAARLSGQVTLLLGWSAEMFWKATPEELATILSAAAPAAAGGGIDRRTLDAMMEQDRNG
ncbi:MAG: hypothetical protein RIS94_547 [Pseudomonadota bacterium]